MALAVAPVALLASALQMFVATFARSFKEAQTYVSLLLIVPMLPGLVTAVYPLQTAAWMTLVPALSQQLLLVDIMGGEPVGVPALAASVAGTLLLTLVFLASIAHMLQQEKIVFGRV